MVGAKKLRFSILPEVDCPDPHLLSNKSRVFFRTGITGRTRPSLLMEGELWPN